MYPFQFSPTSGPIEGGTKITVSGYNLGKQPSDIAVNIGSLLCEVQEENYQPSTQYVKIKGMDGKRGEHWTCSIFRYLKVS